MGEFALAWKIFVKMSSQWKVGMGGAYGLDYTGIPFFFDLYNVETPEEREVVFEQLRELEGVQLEIWDKAREAAK